MQDVFLRRVDELSPDIRTFWFEPSRRMRYIAGQFVDIFVPHAEPDSRGETRQMTLSSSPSEDLVAITIKLSENGSSFKHALRALPIGNRVRMSEPMGDFVLPKDTKLPLVFFSAGVGVTPLRSIVTWLQHKAENRDIQLVNTVRHERDLIFHDTFLDYPMHVHNIVTEPSVNWDGLTGRPGATQLLQLVTYGADTLFYISGPALFTDTVKADLEVLGIPLPHLISDSHPGYLL